MWKDKDRMKVVILIRYQRVAGRYQIRMLGIRKVWSNNKMKSLLKNLVMLRSSLVGHGIPGYLSYVT